MPISSDSPLILASRSRYRAELLERLDIPFTQESSRADEIPLAHEDACTLSQRLANLKTHAVASRYPDRWVLGADQTAQCDGHLLHKPGSNQHAIEQLQLCQGKAAEFYTSVTLMCLDRDRILHAQETTTVTFRHLDAAALKRYVFREPALDCTGGFKMEALGITLFSKIESRDPTALIGLPLIATCDLLAQIGWRPLGPTSH